MNIFKNFSAVALVAVISSLAFMNSCTKASESANNKPIKEGKIGATSFLLISDSGLSLTDTWIQGSGSALAKDPIGEIKSDKNIEISFNLDEGGSVTLSAFGSKKNESGVAFSFLRKDKVLTVIVEAAGKNSNISKNFMAFDASNEVSLIVDVHNGESPAHLLVWKGGTENPTETNALFNSKKAGDGESPGNGTGTFWGLNLSNAAVKTASIAEAKFDHE